MLAKTDCRPLHLYRLYRQFASKLTPTRISRHSRIFRPGTKPVGASLPAKTDFQTLHLYQMYRQFASKLTPTRISRHSRIFRPDTKPVGASLLAKADCQPLHLYRMYRQFVSKLTPTRICGHSRIFRPDIKPVGASLPAKAAFQPLPLHQPQRPLREPARGFPGIRLPLRRDRGLTGSFAFIPFASGNTKKPDIWCGVSGTPQAFPHTVSTFNEWSPSIPLMMAAASGPPATTPPAPGLTP